MQISRLPWMFGAILIVRMLPLSCNKGMSLVSILVAIAIGGIAVMLGSEMVANTSRFLLTLRDESELSGPRNMILIRSDCQKMRESLTCDPTVPILDPNGRQIVAANGSTRIGRYKVKASCKDRRLTVLVAVNGVEPWKDLFPDSSWTCLLVK